MSTRMKKANEKEVVSAEVAVLQELSLGQSCCSLGGIHFEPIFFCINDHVGQGDYPLHTHPFSELFYTVSGTGEVELDNSLLNCKPGHVYISHPRIKHASRWTSTSNEPWRGLIFQYNVNLETKHFAPKTEALLTDEFSPFYSYFYANRNPSFNLNTDYTGKINQFIEQTLHMQKTMPNLDHAFSMTLWIQLVALIADNLRTTGKATDETVEVKLTKKQRQLFHAKKLLEDENSLDMDIESVAKTVNMSEFHFIREFRAAVGISPQKYRLSILMERAGKILTQTSTPIYTIAKQLGYADSSSFSKAFSKYFKISPHRYRVNRVPGGVRVKKDSL